MGSAIETTELTRGPGLLRNISTGSRSLLNFESGGEEGGKMALEFSLFSRLTYIFVSVLVVSANLEDVR